MEINIINYDEMMKYLFLNQMFFLLADIILTIFISNKSRWYQLHVLGNTIVAINIFKSTFLLYIDPLNSYKLLDNHFNSYFILSMHIHHILLFRLNLVDYFHHVLFVLFGILPCIFWIKTNQINYGYIACSGIPGIFEYSLLTLMKNDIITIDKQKKFNAFIYNYLRLPMCIYGASTNLLMLRYNEIIRIDNICLTIYINILLFLNGTIFNQLTLESYYKQKHKYISY